MFRIGIGTCVACVAWIIWYQMVGKNLKKKEKPFNIYKYCKKGKSFLK